MHAGSGLSDASPAVRIRSGMAAEVPVPVGGGISAEIVAAARPGKPIACFGTEAGRKAGAAVREPADRCA